MKKFSILTIFFLLAVIPSYAQTETTPFEYQSVVIGPGEAGDWDDRFTDPGAVIYYNGLFHMFRNGFKGWPASVQIGYLTSEDGITWEEVTPDPIIETDQVEFAEIAALASSVVVTEDGTWMLYFYTWNSNSQWLCGCEIGLATASDPLGEWTIHPEPVLVASESENWDSHSIHQPDVILLEDGRFMMYYTGYSVSGTAMIGLATSDDGINWTRYNDPESDFSLFVESDPVLRERNSTWATGSLHQPRVVQTDDGFTMVFRLRGNGQGAMRLGLATSQDGIEWELLGDAPIFAPSDVDSSAFGFWFTALEHVDDTYYLYVESDGGATGTTIYTYTYSGDIQEIFN